MSRVGKEADKLLATAISLVEAYPTTPKLIDLVSWHADMPTWVLREARKLVVARRGEGGIDEG